MEIDLKYVQDCWLQYCFIALGYLVIWLFGLESLPHFFCAHGGLLCLYFLGFFFVAVVLYHLPTLPDEKQEIKLYFVLNFNL